MKFLIGIGTVAVACAALFGATAGATIGPYAVNARVEPRSAPVNTRHEVAAAGQSANESHLSVYLDTQRCANRRSVEARRPDATLEITANVVGVFTKHRKFIATGIGKQWACSYLTGVAPNRRIQYAAGKIDYRVTS
jgi:hypothetical protein